MSWEGLTPPYATIVADPPWQFDRNGGSGGRRRRRTRLGYSIMSIDDIKALPVAELAGATNLILWSTRDMFREGEAVAVARAWGFEPYGELIWHKRNLGMGAWPRPTHEPVLLARTEGAHVPADRATTSVHTWGQVRGPNNGGKVHSAKPAGLGDLVEAHFPGPYLELFARQPRLGWDHWGHGYEGQAA